MALNTATYLGINRNRMEERLGKTIDFLLPEMDPFFTDMVSTSMGVVPAGQISRDMVVIRQYNVGINGVVEPSGSRNDFQIYGDPLNQRLGSRLFLQGQGMGTQAQTWPEAFDGAEQSTFRLSIPMRGFLGNVGLSMAELRAEATPAFIQGTLMPKMKGHARYYAHQVGLHWWLNQNQFYKLGTVTSAAATATDTVTDDTLIIPVDNLAVDRYLPGMIISFYDATGTTLRASATGISRFMVVAKDDVANRIKVMALDGQSVASVVTSTDIIVLSGQKGTASTPYSANKRFTGLAGPNSWMKFGDGTGANNNLNVILGDESHDSERINVETHPEFRSLLHNRGGQPLTEQLLRKLLLKFHTSKGQWGHTIDCLCASYGVWLGLEATRIPMGTIDRTGKVSSLNDLGSKEGMEIVYDGRKYSGYSSSLIESGTMYGLKKGGGNWEKILPPSPRGAKKSPDAPSYAPFEFVNPILSGTDSIYSQVYRIIDGTNRLTQYVRMPSQLVMQWAPKQVTGMKVVNIAEDRITSGDLATSTVN